MSLHGARSRQAHWRQIAAITTALLISTQAPPAKAWGADGHREIAAFAEAQLSPATKREVVRLLALEPGATLVSISTWADETRNAETAPWHYLNFPRDADCHFDGRRMCRDGDCVTAVITRMAKTLRTQTDDNQRLQTLKYLVHLVADVHQPLHAGYLDDKGGNLVQLQAYGRGSNLHALWDTQLIAHWPGGLPALRSAMQAADKSATSFKPKQWAEQSCQIVATPGFYPVTRKISAQYPVRWESTLAQQLAAAGWRLADVLEQAMARADRQPAAAISP